MGQAVALTTLGARPRRARQLATPVLSARQGALALAGAQRSRAPLGEVLAESSSLLEDAR